MASSPENKKNKDDPILGPEPSEHRRSKSNSPTTETLPKNTQPVNGQTSSKLNIRALPHDPITFRLYRLNFIKLFMRQRKNPNWNSIGKLFSYYIIDKSNSKMFSKTLSQEIILSDDIHHSKENIRFNGPI